MQSKKELKISANNLVQKYFYYQQQDFVAKKMRGIFAARNLLSGTSKLKFLRWKFFAYEFL
jgi:hypothetical protein